MTLFLSLLPLYLFGNLHCMGMCGPLVMMIGQHRYRAFYFWGRLLSYSLTGWLAGEAGALLHFALQHYHVPALLSLSFGGLILLIGVSALTNVRLPSFGFLAPFQRSLSLLMLRDQPWPSFLFGFFTVALPCGQTVVVFSACALAGDGWIGFLNGFVFALLTSPSLYAAMQARGLFQRFRRHYNLVLGGCSCLVGTLALCRGFAEIGWIPHLVLNPHSPSHFHLVIY